MHQKANNVSSKWPRKKKLLHKKAKLPTCYVVSEEEGYCELDLDAVVIMEQAFDHIDNGESFVKAAQWYAETSGKKCSPETMRKLWGVHRGDPKKNPRAKELARQRRKRTPARDAPKEVKDEYKQKNKVMGARLKLAAAEKRLERLKEANNPEPTEETEQVQRTEDGAFETPNESEVLFKPNPGPQTTFLAAPEREVLYGGAAGGGKGTLKTEPVLTPHGWKQAGTLKIGDEICDTEGGVQFVTGVYDLGVRPSYKLTFADKSEAIVCEDHLWHTWIAGGKNKNGKVRDTKEIYKHYSKDRYRRIGVPVMSKACEFRLDYTLPIEPYLLGLLLGDGCISQQRYVTFTTKDNELKDYLLDKCNAKLIQTSRDIYTIGLRGLCPSLKSLGLLGTKSNNKFIPEQYLYASKDDRLALLQGLLDTDGWSEKNGSVYFCSVSKRLIEDVTHLARSLGCYVTCREKIPTYRDKKGRKQYGQKAYTLRLKTDNGQELFRLKRKKTRCRDKKYQSMKNWIVSIEPTEPQDVLCISVSHPNRLYLINNFIVTHNTYALIADPMRYFHHKDFNGIIVRHTTEELREIIWKTTELYPKIFPGCKFDKRASTWNFPSGARLWLTYLERDEDVLRYTGQSFSYIAFDELTHYATPFAWDYMRSRLRTTAPDLPIFMRATCNPGNRGHAWVKKMFIDPAPYGQAFVARNIETDEELRYPEDHPKFPGKPLFERRFIPARLSDNPYLYEDGAGDYEANLLSQPEHIRRKLLEGDWSIVEGAAFPEFREKLHVIEPFRVPRDWTRFRMGDYGYVSPSCILWAAIDPAYQTIVIYDELYEKKLTGTALGTKIKVKELEDDGRVTDAVLDTNAWRATGTNGPTVAEEMLQLGITWRPADKGKNSRSQGKIRLHELLKPLIITDRDGKPVELPRLAIFNTCRHLISTLQSIPADPDGLEDVDKKFTDDHAYDALRYGIMSRPQITNDFDEWYGSNTGPVKPRWEPQDRIFGY